MLINALVLYTLPMLGKLDATITVNSSITNSILKRP